MRREMGVNKPGAQATVVSQFEFKKVGAGAPTYDFQLIFISIGRGPCPDSLK